MYTVNEKIVCGQKSSTSLLILNDDCMERVLSHLSPIEQYKIRSVNRRFDRLVHTIWKFRLRVVDFTDRDLHDFSDEEFLDLMAAISPYVEQLIVRYFQRERFLLLGACTFLRVHTLICVEPYERCLCCFKERYGDEEVLVILQSFPNVQVLRVKGVLMAYVKNSVKLQSSDAAH